MSGTASIQNQTGPDQARFSEQDKIRLQRAVREFESLFIGFLLRSMKSTVPGGSLGGNTAGNDMLGSIAETEFAREISRSSSFGLGEMLYRQITGEKLPPVRLSRPVSGRGGGPAPAPEGGVQNPPQVPGLTGTERTAAVLFPRNQARPVPRNTVAERVNTYAPYVREAAERHRVDPGLIKAVIAAESAGRADARSGKQAKGLMQLIDTTAADLGVRNVWDPRENILGGARYLRQMLDRFGGDVSRALASYNAGPATVERHGGVPPFRETREYIQRVMKYLTLFGQEDNDGND